MRIKNFSILLFLTFLTIGGLSGCRIDFDAETVVHEDGSVTRRSRYTTRSEEKKRELDTHYKLLSGGNWTVSDVPEESDDDQQLQKRKIYIYETTAQYAPGVRIVPDYGREAEYSDRVSHNDIQLKVNDYLFVKTIDYQETFHDITTRERSEKALNKLYILWLKLLSEEMVRESGKRLSPEQVHSVVKASFDPVFSDFMVKFRQQGPRLLFDEKYQKEIESLIEPARIADRLKKLMPPGAAGQVNTWEDTVGRALENAYNRGSEYIQTHEPGVIEDVIGVYSNSFVSDYAFNVSVTLPGKILTSNASQKEGDKLIWDFDHVKFKSEPYRLFARSRLIYPRRIAIGAVILTVMVLGLIIMVRQRSSL